jgi:uncharacterized RDD family membrane protein YckC
MRSLEEIYIDKVHKHKERGTDGKVRDISRNVRLKFEVKSPSAILRMVHLMVDVNLVNLAGYFILGSDYEFFAIILLPFYYFIMEFLFQRTIGKILTNSIVIDEFAKRPDFRTMLLRTIIRLLPFEVYSFFVSSRGWHDRWSRTYVISRGELSKLTEMVNKPVPQPTTSPAC